MTTCTACLAAEHDELSGLFNAYCKDCDTRSLSQSPAFFDSALSGVMTPVYLAALRFVFGDDFERGHMAVKALADRRMKARERAKA